MSAVEGDHAAKLGDGAKGSLVDGADGRSGAVLRAIGAIEAVFDWLHALRSAGGVTTVLLPVLVLLMLPTKWGPNEDFYFMLSFKQVMPEAFSPYSAAFDASNARILSELVIGGTIALLGYQGAQIVLHLVMAALYAFSLAYCLTGLRLSAVDALLALGIFVLVGPDLMGGEWLFLGVEPKTFAYAFVLFALGLVCRERAGWAAAALVVATYFHFLVGGFWAVAIFAFHALRTDRLRPVFGPLAGYVAGVTPLLALLVYDRYVAGGAPVPEHGLTSDYIYSILRSAWHVAPFVSLTEFRGWADGIVATIALCVAFTITAARVSGNQRALVVWIAGLLLYLLAALFVTYLDRHTGHLGKFFLFRPSSLVLLLSIVAAISLLNWIGEGRSGPPVVIMQRAAFVVVTSLLVWEAGSEKLGDLILGGSQYADLAGLAEFVQKNAEPDAIILTNREADMGPPGVHLPRLLDRPTLVSEKFVPTNPADIYRWYDLLKFKEAVFAGDCPGPEDPPVRYLLLVEPEHGREPPCGEVIWRSRHFVLAELPPRIAAGGQP
jgi:hypothetical protein